MAIYNMPKPQPGQKPSYNTKPMQPANPVGVSAPAPEPKHSPHVTLPQDNAPKAGGQAMRWNGSGFTPTGKTYNQYGQPIGSSITPQQPLTTTWGMPQQTIQPLGGGRTGGPMMGGAMVGGPMSPPQSTQPTGGRIGGAMAGGSMPPPQTTQPTGGRMGMAGTPIQQQMADRARNYGQMFNAQQQAYSQQPPPQTINPVGQRIGGSMSGGGALADALSRRQANSQQGQPQARPNDNLSILMQMLR